MCRTAHVKQYMYSIKSRMHARTFWQRGLACVLSCMEPVQVSLFLTSMVLQRQCTLAILLVAPLYLWWGAPSWTVA